MKFAAHIERAKIQIATAASEISGRLGKIKAAFLPSGKELKLGRDGKAVFSPSIQENLASVGRICEGGLAILFDENGYQILEEC